MTAFYFALTIGLILIISEIGTNSFYLLIIGLSCIIAGILNLILHSWMYSIIISCLIATIGIVIVNYLKNKNKSAEDNTLIVKHLGQTVTVVEITAHNLRVEYSGSFWNAKLKNKNLIINPGDALIITNFTNNELEVDAANKI
ncbi:MAG: NfeD family protein [Burkholderiales bacterium]|nr:NfeD family protein [Burkholderiales bacterium]